MASVTTPTINKIIRLKSYDLLGTKCVKYNMYMCLDTLQLWYDESDSKRTLYSYVGVDTVNDLQNNLIPELGTTYYCWESNSLWLWMNRWICIYTDGKYPSAYRTDNGSIDAVYLDDQNPTIVDNNGLLRDGSVVIRDANRIIKGRLYINDTNDNLVISSYLGGGVRILPNGAMSTDGELYIDDDARAHLRGEWNVLNNEIYVDYTEKPAKDKSKYADDTHRYKVWHEGNLKLEDLELTGLNIYNKIIDAQKDGSLPNPLVLNVNQLNGMKSTDFALKNHIHSSSDISDFAQAAQANANTAMMDKLTNMIFKGAKITWVEASQKYQLSTDNFILAFTGGVTGSGTVVNNTNTTIALEVDPTKHVHQDLVTRIEALEAGGGGGDLSNYYTKTETDAQIANMFSATPVQGKALLVNSSRTLPANAETASDLDHNTVLTLNGDITGNVTFGYELTALTLTTDAGNIVSSSPTAGKALKLDSNADLPAKSYSSKELDHEITVKLIGDVEGTASLDTSTNQFQITTKITESADNAVPWSAVGTRVASLENGIIPDTQLPEGIMNALKLVSSWQGSTAPSSNPTEGQAWVVSADSTFNGTKYRKGDWIYYFNSSWNRADLGVAVKSVNGVSGEDIILTPSDINAIPDSYINYTVGATIPANKIVVTNSNGHIAGATVDNLTNEFAFKLSSGDIRVDSSSTRTKTDGSNDLDMVFKITDNGYTNIKNNAVPSVITGTTTHAWRKYINFAGFTAEDTGTQLNLSLSKDETSDILYFTGTATNDFKETLTGRIEERADKPFYVAFVNNGALQFAPINGNTAFVTGNNDIITSENTVSWADSKTSIKTSKLRITLGNTMEVTGVSIQTSTAEHSSLQLSGGVMSGLIRFSDNVGGIQGQMGSNDYYRIIGNSTATDSGYLEIATCDNGNEPVYVRQYKDGMFTTLVRTATLLDESGNTKFPRNSNCIII